MNNTVQSSDFSDVFVSYRRKDVEFVKPFVAQLRAAGKEVWIDWEDIPPGSIGFSDDIRRGLEGADAFIAILTPSYLESTYCVDLELGTAVSLNKKIIPVVLEKFDGQPVPDGIGHINWIYFTPHAGHENTFDESFPKVLQALDIDLAHMRTSKRLLLRALEWDRNGRGGSYLLTGDEITAAESWISGAAGKDPAPTQTQQDYIIASRAQATKRQRQILSAVGVALVISLMLAVLATWQFLEASQQRDQAERSAEIARSIGLAATARELNTTNQIQAVPFALEAIDVDTPPLIAQRALSEIAYQRGAVQIIATSERSINAITTHPDVDGFITAGENGLLTAWDAASGTVIREYDGHSDDVFAAAFSPSGERLVSAGEDGEVFVWDTATGERIAALEGHPDDVLAVAFQLDGDLLATAGRDEVIRLWNTRTWEPEDEIGGFVGAIHGLAFSHQGATLAAVGTEAVVRLWDVRSGELTHEWAGVHRDTIYDVAFHPGNPNFVTVSADRNVILWDLNAPGPIGTLVAHINPIQQAVFSDDGRYLLTVAEDQVGILWNYNSRLPVHTFTGHDDQIYAGAFSGDTRQVITGGRGGEVIVWAAEPGDVLNTYRNHTAGVNDIAVAADGAFIVSAGDDGTVVITDTANGDALQTFEPPGADEQRGAIPIKTVLLINDDTEIITGDADGHLLRRSIASGEVLTRYSGHMQDVSGLSLSPDGTRFVSGGGESQEPELFVYNVADSEPVFALAGHNSHVEDAAYSPDGAHIVSVSNSGEIVLWDAATGEELRRFPGGHGGAVYVVTFNPDGSQLATGGEDGLVVLWDVASGTLVDTYSAHTSRVEALAFSADGSQLASGADDSIVYLWSIGFVEPERAYTAHLGSITALVPYPNSRALISAAKDGSVIHWRVETLDNLQDWIAANRFVIEISCATWQRFEREFGVTIREECVAQR